MTPSSLILGLYCAVLALLAVYGVHRLWLLLGFRWSGRAAALGPGAAPLPRLTVQLPLYNERTVAARLLRAAGALDYPAGMLELQVLDDSDDETRAIVDREVAALVARGVDARVLRRGDRAGFKAGALDFGMGQARGELFCVFERGLREDDPELVAADPTGDIR